MRRVVTARSPTQGKHTTNLKIDPEKVLALQELEELYSRMKTKTKLPQPLITQKQSFVNWQVHRRWRIRKDARSLSEETIPVHEEEINLALSLHRFYSGISPWLIAWLPTLSVDTAEYYFLLVLRYFLCHRCLKQPEVDLPPNPMQLSLHRLSMLCDTNLASAMSVDIFDGIVCVDSGPTNLKMNMIWGV